MNWLRRFWPYLTLILAPLLVLWPAIVGGRAIGAFDQIRAMSPWGAPPPDKPWDVLQADGVLQFYVWRDLVFSSWGQGHTPAWNPYELAGTPLLANSQSGALYPPHVLVGVLHIPTAFGMALLAWFHLAWAGLGAYFLARRIGAGRSGGVVAGVSFSLSAFMVAWTGLPSVITTVAWIPWVLALTISLFRGNHITSFLRPNEEKSSSRQIRRTLLLGLSLGMMILAGHLQFVAYGGVAAAVMVVWLIVVSYDSGPISIRHAGVRGLVSFAIAGVIGFAIAAPQILPVLEYSQFSHRRNAPSEEGYLAYQASAIQPFELIGVMHPNLTGSPSSFVPNIEEDLPAYWPGYVKRGANFAEAALGLGPLVIGLLLVARRRLDWRITGGVALVALTAFLLATGTALGRVLYFWVPGWSSTGSPGRIVVLFVLAMCVLAGVAATHEPDEQPAEKWRTYVPVGGMAVIALVSIYALMFALTDLRSWLPQMQPGALEVIIANSTGLAKATAAISTLIAAVALGYWLKEHRKPSWVLVVATFICLLLSVPSVLRFSDSADLGVEGPTQERIAVINENWDLLSRAPATLPPNTASASRIHELGGYDSLMHRDTVALLAFINGQDPAPPANGNMMFIKPSADPERLAEAGVTEVWSQGPGGLMKTPIAGRGRAYTDAGPAEILEETGHTIRLRATGPGKLILKDRNMPGWTATVDGKPVGISGELWREVELSNGEHEVEMRYTPPGYRLGTILAIPAWLLIVAGLAVLTFRRRPEEPIEESLEQI